MDKDKPLPKPPASRFGMQRRPDDAEDPLLMADRIASAAAEGKLEEFMRNEIPDSDSARKLVAMMMEMTGVSPAGQAASAEAAASETAEKESHCPTGKHGKEQASFDKNTLDTLLRIASENDVTPDWIIHRAVRLYMAEYQKTGRL